jgi:hypothetical protein
MGGVVPTPAEVVGVARRAWVAAGPRPGDDDPDDEADPLGLIVAGAWAERRRQRGDR